ncbi:MAG: cytochrome oxidase putative small subunit CydP [Alphaproteobacteria bacterium]
MTGHISSLRHKLAHKLTREIVAVLVFKAAFLAVLYFAFFANPAPRDASGILFSPAASTMPAETR